MKPAWRGIDRIAVTFDEANLVASAGLTTFKSHVPVRGQRIRVGAHFQRLMTKVANQR